MDRKKDHKNKLLKIWELKKSRKINEARLSKMKMRF